jgi:ankyrin repeat protein
MMRTCNSLPNFTLSVAAELGENALKEFLLQSGLEINSSNECGVTPLHSAAGDGRLNAVIVLLKNGANVNARCRGLDTPLHWALTGASYENSEEIVKVLLQNGADCTIKDDSKRSPLSVAKMYRNKVCISAVKARYEVQTGLRCGSCSKSFGIVERVSILG